MLPTNWMSYCTVGCSATRQPVSTRSVSPAPRSMRGDHAAGMHEAEAVAIEPLHDEAFTAEEADADLPWKAMPMQTPRAAQRNESFWQTR